MPNWKKLIVSGSDANLSNLNVDNAVTASFFVGDGSSLTGITSTVVETATVTDTFTSQTSVAVSHNFNTRNILVSVYDNSYNQVIPASVVLTDLDTVTVGFDSSTSGTVVVAKGGHVVSGSLESATSASLAVTASVVKETRAGGVLEFWKGTQAQYDALGSYDDNTIYFVE